MYLNAVARTSTSTKIGNPLFIPTSNFAISPVQKSIFLSEFFEFFFFHPYQIKFYSIHLRE